MPYQVDLATFHGPLDLLLFLVKRNEVDILDIPIASVAEQFLHYLEVIEFIDVEMAGDFLVMAATLMEIKSKLLLPRTEELPEEEPDPRRELVKQLLEYRKFKDAAEMLEERSTQQQTHFPREPISDTSTTDTPQVVKKVELWDLVSAFGRLMRELTALEPTTIVMEEVPPQVIESTIIERLTGKESISFRSLFTPPYQRSRLVGFFLSLLEMIKRKMIWLDQPEPFGEILIRLRTDEA
jgi:segregation and condensation protein A